jgi:prevent-host-death family protein
MSEMAVGVRELKARLSGYLRRVKSGATLIITERGKPVGRIVPMGLSTSERVEELAESGLLAWSGRRLMPIDPPARTKGATTVSDLLLEDRE